ncbi:MAG: DUF4956 domain-containing protein [Lachnospiraceae bacterium]|nr:DUF4956 domain-containing protein [Lachnospiraceae bacterium]MDE6962920.1 DUF4956 domain-containing protein [Lachnospiraceae bacterium]
MNFSDIFKKGFLASYTSENISVPHITAVLLITAAIAAYIFIVYRLITKKTFYSKNFNIALAGIAVVTAGIILAVQSSIVISLGMVGALSIVRFRTAIKEPMDLCFLFWSIAVGICCGAHMTEVAVVLSLVLTVLVIILDRLPVGRAPMILVANLSDSKEEPALTGKVGEYCKYYKVKSRNIAMGQCNLVMEVRAAREYEMMQELARLSGVESVSLVSHDGEVTF